jgi:hypothetical protein
MNYNIKQRIIDNGLKDPDIILIQDILREVCAYASEENLDQLQDLLDLNPELLNDQVNNALLRSCYRFRSSIRNWSQYRDRVEDVLRTRHEDPLTVSDWLWGL